ncbi:MAG TPA: type II toxin-antitoxin system ParD family antitoxin [Edaphobacter sp.]|jgi:antitoxin ParD1/3/4|nr:type II toxin-antitoxin system ParD family antitoxin [Edaphobacter sp.]
MPTRNVSLTDELDSYVEQSVQSGHYDNASEVVRAAIRELKQSELEDKAKVEALRAAIQEGFDSGIYEGDVMAEMRTLIRQRAAENAQIRERRSA